MDTPVVNLTKLDDSIIKMRTDPKKMKESKNIIDKLVKYHISSMIGLHMPDFHKDFPDKIPPKLWYPGKNLNKSAEKVKKETSTLEEEAKKFVKEEPSLIPQRKRRTRFAGSYRTDGLQQPASVVEVKKKVRTISEASSNSLASSTSQKVKPITVKYGRGKDPFIKPPDFSSSSGSSGDSSDSEHENPAQKQKSHEKAANSGVCYQTIVDPQQTAKQPAIPSYQPVVLLAAVSSPQIISHACPAAIQSPVRTVNPFRARRQARQLSDSSSDEEVVEQSNKIAQHSSIQEVTPAADEKTVGAAKTPESNKNEKAQKDKISQIQTEKTPAAEKLPEIQSTVSEKPDIPEKVLQTSTKLIEDSNEAGKAHKKIVSQDSVTVTQVPVKKTAQKPETEFKKPERAKRSPIDETTKVKAEKTVRKSLNKLNKSANEAKKFKSNQDVKQPKERKSYEKPKVIEPPMVSTVRNL